MTLLDGERYAWPFRAIRRNRSLARGAPRATRRSFASPSSTGEEGKRFATGGSSESNTDMVELQPRAAGFPVARRAVKRDERGRADV